MRNSLYFGGFEICQSDVSRNDVDLIYQEWKTLGTEFELKPTDLEFGYTFVAIDPSLK